MDEKGAPRGRYGEIWRDLGRYGEICGDVRRYAEIGGDQCGSPSIAFARLPPRMSLLLDGREGSSADIVCGRGMDVVLGGGMDPAEGLSIRRGLVDCWREPTWWRGWRGEGMILNFSEYHLRRVAFLLCTPSPGSSARFLYVCCVYAGADAVAGVERRRKES